MNLAIPLEPSIDNDLSIPSLPTDFVEHMVFGPYAHPLVHTQIILLLDCSIVERKSCFLKGNAT